MSSTPCAWVCCKPLGWRHTESDGVLMLSGGGWADGLNTVYLPVRSKTATIAVAILTQVNLATCFCSLPPLHSPLTEVGSGCLTWGLPGLQRGWAGCFANCLIWGQFGLSFARWVCGFVVCLSFVFDYSWKLFLNCDWKPFRQVV